MSAETGWKSKELGGGNWQTAAARAKGDVLDGATITKCRVRTPGQPCGRRTQTSDGPQTPASARLQTGKHNLQKAAHLPDAKARTQDGMARDTCQHE